MIPNLPLQAGQDTLLAGKQVLHEGPFRFKVSKINHKRQVGSILNITSILFTDFTCNKLFPYAIQDYPDPAKTLFSLVE
jgi:hypothetical protein